MGNTVSILQVTAGNGTAQQFKSTVLNVSSFWVQAAAANTAAVYFGDSTTKASTGVGIYVPAPATAVPAAPIGPFHPPSGTVSLALTEWFADSGTASQKLNILYLTD